jgi:hypothetical protein
MRDDQGDEIADALDWLRRVDWSAGPPCVGQALLGFERDHLGKQRGHRLMAELGAWRRHVVGGEFAGRGSGQCRGDHRVAAPGWLVIGDVLLRGKSGELVWIVLGRRGAATDPRGGAGGLRCASEEGPGAVLSRANGGVPPWVAGKPWTRTPAATGQG